MVFHFKNVLIYGYERSGRAVEKILKDIGVNYKIYDENIKIDGGEFILKLNEKVLSRFDLIVISPGVSIYNKYLKIADRLNIKIISELEFGYWFTSAEIIAVTGTNGKTTTTKMITDVLKLAGYNCDAYGNIGLPLSEAYKKNYDYIVCEVSSFQLEAIDKFTPLIGILLNIAPDHIDRHKSFKNYLDCKLSLFKNCESNNYAVIDKNIVDSDTNCINNSINIRINDKSCGNIYEKMGEIFKNDKKILKINKNLQKFTYIENILAVLNVMDILNIDFNLINKIDISNYNEHRMQLFLKSKGVDYIDDSKATNPHAVLKALQVIKGNIILLVGGKNKKIDFSQFVKALPNNIKKVLIFGGSGKEILKSFKGSDFEVELFQTLKQATLHACDIASKGDVVLLSPACASFDEFSSYAERGDFFKNLVISKVKNDKVKE